MTQGLNGTNKILYPTVKFISDFKVTEIGISIAKGYTKIIFKHSYKNDTANLKSLKHGRKRIEKDVKLYLRTNNFSPINVMDVLYIFVHLTTMNSGKPCSQNLTMAQSLKGIH